MVTPGGSTPPPPVIHNKLPELVRAVAIVDDNEIELHTDRVNTLPRWGGRVVLHFSKPVKPPHGFDYLPEYHDGITDPTFTSPDNLRDREGNTVPQYQFSFRVVPNAKWVSGALTEDIKMPSHSAILMPGEHIRIELPTDITPETFEQKISGLFKGVKYDLEFANHNIALLSFQTADAKHVEIRLTDSDIPSLALEIVPQKRLLVLSTNGHILSSLDVPISTAGAISMSKDYSTVRIVRPVYTNWTYVPLREYQWNIKTGAVVPASKSILYPQSYEYNTFDDWANTGMPSIPGVKRLVWPPESPTTRLNWPSTAQAKYPSLIFQQDR